ncbi:hypothetical protein JTB14_005986 [Gonioctena quinquepunctata]|nr:hypothetical protein JTB14_005986 [Gonioctena quinquepunctata]
MRCMKCNNVEANPNLLMACDSCSRDIHKKCSDLNASEIRVIDLKGPRKLKFFCDDCHNGLPQVPKILKDIDDSKTSIDHLKSEMNAKPTASSDYCQSEDALLSEIHDRLRRSNNVLLFNVPESNNDMKSATVIFNKLSSEPIAIRSTVRFGKRNKLGFRSLKVTFPSNHDVCTVLNGRSLLKGCNIFISNDLTPKQREHETKIKDELKSRTSNGENVTLKYLNGTPRIVPKTCQHPVPPTLTSPSTTRTSSASPTELASANESISIEIISNTICLHNLFQINNILNSYNSLFDLVMIQKNNIVIKPANDVWIQDPYHPPLSFELPVSHPAINSEICPSGYYHDFKSANLMLIRELLDQVSWDELFKNKPLDHIINILYEILYKAIDFLRALTHRLAKRNHQNYIESIEQSVTNDIKAFWRFANGKKTISIPPELSYNGEVSSSGGEIANLFAEYFSTSIATKLMSHLSTHLQILP